MENNEKGIDEQTSDKIDMDKIFIGQSKSNLIRLETLINRLNEVFDENRGKMLEKSNMIQILDLEDNLDKKFIENALNELIEEGILYEPKTNMIKFKQEGDGLEKEKGDKLNE